MKRGGYRNYSWALSSVATSAVSRARIRAGTNMAGSRDVDWLIQPDAVIGVPLGHVGENHAIAGLETGNDLDRVDRTATELNLSADRIVGALGEFENADGALFLAEGRAPHEDHLVKSLEFDRAVDGQVRTRAARQ